MALRCSFAVMAILLAEILITLGASPNPGLSTSSAGRAKKDWGRGWENVVAMGVAWGWAETIERELEYAEIA